MQASIRTVKDRFSEFVRLARRGEEIIVTSHDKPVAKLVALSEEERGRVPGREALLAELLLLRESLAGRHDGQPLSETVVLLREGERY
ncbi:MAG: type II toxin-antitoxin system prevent-host-death family antitoxin [Deltaproteobacteria bacterium]|nr:type II toxin-antitoxin system prevent-host-death family antitoxin [Deltaproteobacteria bacterium]